MAQLLDPNTIGPVDIALVVFEGNDFTGDVAPALAELNDSGTVHIIDLAFVSKDADGTTTVIEVEDADVASAFAGLTGDRLDLLNDEDLDLMAADLEPEHLGAGRGVGELVDGPSRCGRPGFRWVPGRDDPDPG